MAEKKIAVLLVNLGSPSALNTSAVRAFLKQFLWDKRVVNLPRPLWWLILHTVILPFRPKKSLHAYQKIWRTDGSPLVVFTQALTEKVTMLLANSTYLVNCAMSYGEPSIANQLAAFKTQQVEEIVVVPLYPQYSSTTTASVYDAVTAVLNHWRYIPTLRFISDYHQHPLYIEAIAQSISRSWQQQGRAELLLFSFHGLPEQLTDWGDPYFYQCHNSAALIAARLHLQPQQWQVVFQSRFGRTKWLQPYCVETLQSLPSQGIKSVEVICPGFAVDCLETLEEIAMTNKAIFIQAGGNFYSYIAALNDSQEQVELIKALIIK